MESVAAERLNKIGKNPSLVSNRAELEDDMNTVNEIIMQTTPLASSGSDVSLIDMAGVCGDDDVIVSINEDGFEDEPMDRSSPLSRSSSHSNHHSSRNSSRNSSRTSSRNSIQNIGRNTNHHGSRHSIHSGSHHGSNPNSLHGGATGSDQPINMKKSRSDSYVGLAGSSRDDRESLVWHRRVIFSVF